MSRVQIWQMDYDAFPVVGKYKKWDIKYSVTAQVFVAKIREDGNEGSRFLTGKTQKELEKKIERECGGLQIAAIVLYGDVVKVVKIVGPGSRTSYRTDHVDIVVDGHRKKDFYHDLYEVDTKIIDAFNKLHKEAEDFAKKHEAEIQKLTAKLKKIDTGKLFGRDKDEDE